MREVHISVSAIVWRLLDLESVPDAIRQKELEL